MIENIIFIIMICFITLINIFRYKCPNCGHNSIEYFYFDVKNNIDVYKCNFCNKKFVLF